MAVKHITNSNFQSEVLEAAEPVLVDFWAPWCGPCQMLSPVINQIGEEVTDAKICKVNVDENQELAMQYGVMSIPTIMVFKNGKVAAQTVGARPKSEILEMLK